MDFLHHFWILMHLETKIFKMINEIKTINSWVRYDAKKLTNDRPRGFVCMRVSIFSLGLQLRMTYILSSIQFSQRADCKSSVHSISSPKNIIGLKLCSKHRNIFAKLTLKISSKSLYPTSVSRKMFKNAPQVLLFPATIDLIFMATCIFETKTCKISAILISINDRRKQRRCL